MVPWSEGITAVYYSEQGLYCEFFLREQNDGFTIATSPADLIFRHTSGVARHKPQLDGQFPHGHVLPQACYYPEPRRNPYISLDASLPDDAPRRHLGAENLIAVELCSQLILCHIGSGYFTPLNTTAQIIL